MAQNFHDYRQQLADADSSTFLGRLCWFTVSETKVAHTTLAEEMDKADLAEFTPRPPRDDDVFRRVFQNGQRRRVEIDEDTIENYLIREVDRSGGHIVKHVVIETVDRKGRRLGYDAVLEVEFTDEHPENVRVAPIDGQPILSMNAFAMGMVGEMAAEYRETRGTVNSQAVRDVLRRVLDSAMATVVRPGGGVYFVMEEKADKVDAVERLGAVIPGTVVHSLPLIDDAKQRDMLRKAFEDESVGEIDRTIEEILALVNAGEKITAKKFDKIAARRGALLTKMDEYKGLLRQTMSSTEFRLKIFEAELTQLYKLVDSGAAASTRRSA